MKKFNDIVWSITAAGLPRGSDIETLRKLIMLNFLFGLASFFLFLLGAIAFYQNNFILFAADFRIGIIAILLLIWMRKKQNPQYVDTIGVVIAGLLFIFLIANGGVNQTAFVWGFTFPLLSVFLLGSRTGMFTTIIFILLTLVIFIAGHQVSYISEYSVDLCKL